MFVFFQGSFHFAELFLQVSVFFLGVFQCCFVVITCFDRLERVLWRVVAGRRRFFCSDW